MSRRTCSCLLLIPFLAACGGFPTAPAYPDQAKGAKEGDFVEPDDAGRPGLPNDKPPPLTLYPGDTISVEIVSTETQAITGLVIDATGKVHLPLAGDVEVGGLGLTDTETRLKAALQKFDRLVVVNVQMTGRAGQRATVLGAVTTQGPVELIPGARVTDVVAGAGGPTATTSGPNQVVMADLAGAVLMRQGKVVPIDMRKALLGEPVHNVFVHPGDHIYVPPSVGANISMFGQVGSPQVFPHREGLRLTEALALAGGVTVGADKGDIRVIRGTLAKPKVYRASLSDVIDGDAHDVLLRPGDIVFVTDHPIEDFGEVMAVIAPALTLGLSSVALGLTLESQ
ncbi:MAG: SLBB domain-containing protein [Myxococcales bacterium]|nr:SLBB domain-containing protein [Myxococcales bacterium]